MMQDTAGRRFVRAAMRAPYLKRDEERDLAERWRDKHDQQALNRITLSHMRLVIAMATKFRHFGLPVSDLVQEGHVGLLEAAARFEPERGVRFSTYATWWIRASMQDYILRNWSIVRGGTSSSQKALFFNLRRLRARLANGTESLSGDALYKEVSAALGVPEADVAMMDSRLSAPDSSLNAPLADESGSAERQDFLVDGEPLPDEVVGELIDLERRACWLNSALSALNDRELRIIKQRRLRDEGATLEELGLALGISKERVRQIEARAMEKLKAALIRQNPEFLATAA
jgi:RNA polymerase sigma-32 factor